MGLAHRVIPTILVRGRTLVKGKRFDSWRSVGLAAQAVRIHAARGVDEVVLLDIGATPEGRGPDLSLVEELADVLFSPLAVGGGVRSVDDVRALLRAGADKVVIGSAQFPVPNIVQEAAAIVGSQAIVAAVDVRAGKVMKQCGRELADPTWTSEFHLQGYVSAADWAREIAQWGAGEILLTSIDREGTMAGYDLDLIRQVRGVVRCPVVAHGGCSGYEDMAAAIGAGASAVAAGALFQFTDCTPRDAARYLHAIGIEARV